VTVPDSPDIRDAIEIKEVPAQAVLLIREHVRFHDLSDVIGRDLGEVFAHAQASGTGLAGPPFVLYPAMGDDGTGDVEIGIPVEEGAEGSGRIEYEVLPASTMLTYEHRGHYQELGDVHRALWQLVESEGLSVQGAPRELYLNDPEEQASPADWVTEVQLPVPRDAAARLG
jgi:effector-binding domain-containing protein